MNRRGFISRLGLAAAAVACAPVIKMLDVEGVTTMPLKYGDWAGPIILNYPQYFVNNLAMPKDFLEWKDVGALIRDSDSVTVVTLDKI